MTFEIIAVTMKKYWLRIARSGYNPIVIYGIIFCLSQAAILKALHANSIESRERTNIDHHLRAKSCIFSVFYFYVAMKEIIHRDIQNIRVGYLFRLIMNESFLVS